VQAERHQHDGRDDMSAHGMTSLLPAASIIGLVHWTFAQAESAARMAGYDAWRLCDVTAGAD
jgi:hypothetical protein